MKTFMQAIFIRHFEKIRRYNLAVMFALMFVLSTGQLSAQTKTYLEGQKTGDRYNIALLGILGLAGAGVSAPMLSYTSPVFGTQVFRYYYGTSTILTGTSTEFTTLTSARGIGALNIDLAGADVYVQFRNTSNAAITPAGKTTYFKLGSKPVVSGLQLNAGALLGLENLYNIKGSAYKSAGNYINTGTGTINEGVPIDNDDQTVTKLIIDKDGLWYAAVTPPSSEAYNSVRLSVEPPKGLNVVSLGYSQVVNVHNSFTMSAGTNCSPRPIFTSYGNSGISLTAGSLIGGLDLNSLVTHAEYAIDDAPEPSIFNTGIGVGIANTVAQQFIYDHTATANDAVNIHLAISENLIALNLLSAQVTFKAYNGTSNVAVATKTLEETLTLLGLNVAGLVTINSGFRDVNASFKPGVAFDRVEVSLGGLASVGVLADALRIYDVNIASPSPTITASITLGANNSVTVYQGQALPTITATSPGNNILWYLGASETPLTGSPTLSTFALPVSSIATAGSYIYYAAAQRPGCTNISAKVPVNITVLPITLATLINGTLHSAYSFPTAVAASAGRNLSYEILGGALPAGMSLHPTTGIVSGTPTRSGVFTISVKVTDTTDPLKPIDAGTYPYSVTIITDLGIVGGAFPQAIKGTAYSQALPTNLGGRNGVPPYSYAIVPTTSGGARIAVLPDGLTLSSDGTLSGTPSVIASSTFTVKATDSENNVLQANFTVDVVNSPLPVTLASFTVEKENQTALLYWTTTSESSSESFDIERSANGKGWIKIADKAAKGESSSLLNYSYTDGSPLEGENLYRLKMIDRDRTFAFSRIQSLKFSLDATLKVYPNPVLNSENLQIGIADWSLIKSVKIINASGDLVFESTGSLATGVQTHQLKSGFYFVQVIQKDGKITTRKFVKL